MEKSENNAADGPGIAYLEYPICSILKKKPNANIRPKDFKHAAIRLRSKYPEAQVKRCTLPDGIWGLFIGDRWRIVFKHVRSLRRHPKKLTLAMAQCNGEQAMKLQRIMNLTKVGCYS